MPDQPEVTIEQYRPLIESQLKRWEGEDVPMPSRVDFREGEQGRWVGMMNPVGTILVNIVHRGYPDSYCQVQMSPDASGEYNTWFLHGGPEEGHIPERVVEDLFVGQVLPKVEEYIQSRTIM